MRALSIALVHYPVLDAKGSVAVSTLTTIDVHDLARSAKTFGCEHFYIVHPIEAQRGLARRIIDHWTDGSSAKRIPDRKNALAITRIVETIDDATNACGEGTEIWATAARSVGTPTSFRAARETIGRDGPPVLLVFGTSWGLAPEVIERASVLLEPIIGPSDFNHLSVRAACAIALDRLAAPRGP
jgi:hypothetical protein